ncbi:hypothetical protein HDV00_006887, partial [Rhizophlyctis rosea]
MGTSDVDGGISPLSGHTDGEHFVSAVTDVDDRIVQDVPFSPDANPIFTADEDVAVPIILDARPADEKELRDKIPTSGYLT